MPDDVENRLVGELDVLLFEAVRLALLLEQVLLGDLELLGLGVAGDTNDLQAVLQGPRNPLQRIGGGDEHHLREVVIAIQVMVVEGVVLLGIKHFE